MKKIIKTIIFILLTIMLYLGVVTVLPTSSSLNKSTGNDEQMIQLATLDDINDYNSNFVFKSFNDLTKQHIKEIELKDGKVISVAVTIK